MPWKNGEIEEEKALAVVRRTSAPTMASGLPYFIYYFSLLFVACSVVLSLCTL
jgi:hypothetical protein